MISIYLLIKFKQNTSFKSKFSKAWLQLRVIGGAKANQGFTEM